MEFFSFYLGFLSRTFTNHRTAGEEGGISLTPHYHFHLLHRNLHIIQEITAGSLPLLTYFLDDTLGISNSFEKALEKSTFVLNSLNMAASIVNLEQSLWQLTKVLTLIDIEVDLNSDTLKISSETSSSVLFIIDFVLSKNYIAARALSKLADTLVSIKFVTKILYSWEKDCFTR